MQRRFCSHRLFLMSFVACTACAGEPPHGFRASPCRRCRRTSCRAGPSANGNRDLDRASIQAALDEVPPGGTVQFAAGIYIIGFNQPFRPRLD